ncbi:hypothetical protein D3C85_1549840 [compost metagenome]
MGHDMRIGQEGLPGLQGMRRFPHGNLARTCVNEMDFVQIADARTDRMTGSTLLGAPVMQMQIGAAAERTLRIIFKYGHASASFLYKVVLDKYADI